MSEPVPPNAFAVRFVVTEDMVDVQGRVSNHEYVRLLAQAAAEHSASLGWGLEAYRRLGAWWVVRRHEIDYLQPAHFGDELLCRTWPCGVSKASARRRHVIERPSDGTRILEALNTWALIDVASGRPRRIPRELIEAFDPARWTDATG